MKPGVVEKKYTNAMMLSSAGRSGRGPGHEGNRFGGSFFFCRKRKQSAGFGREDSRRMSKTFIYDVMGFVATSTIVMICVFIFN